MKPRVRHFADAVIMAECELTNFDRWCLPGSEMSIRLRFPADSRMVEAGY